MGQLKKLVGKIIEKNFVCNDLELYHVFGVNKIPVQVYLLNMWPSCLNKTSGVWLNSYVLANRMQFLEDKNGKTTYGVFPFVISILLLATSFFLSSPNLCGAELDLMHVLYLCDRESR